jgi:hypothetical protein
VITVGDITITTTLVGGAINVDAIPDGSDRAEQPATSTVSADGGVSMTRARARAEPASLMLFGTGLGFAARQLRKRRFHNS